MIFQRFFVTVVFIAAAVIRFSFAQTNVYHPLPDSNAVWMKTESQPIPNPTNYYRTFLHLYKDDTIIGGKEYIKIFKDGISNGTYYAPFYIGAYRSDSSGKTFIVPKDSINECLLYDLSKQAGDTVQNVFVSSSPNSFEDYYVDSTSSISMGPYQLKALYLHDIDSITINYYKNIVWVEKVGCLGDLLNQGCYFPWSPPAISCMCVSDTIYYEGGCILQMAINNGIFPYTYGECSMPMGIEQINMKGKIKIFPNPSSDKIFFENLPSEKIGIRITNILGQEIYNVQLQNVNTYSISIEESPPRMYFLTIQTASDVLLNQIIIKQ